MGSVSLKELFPMLFSISKQKEARVENVGAWNHGVWVWNLEWRRELFVWENQYLVELLSLLETVSLNKDSLDVWGVDFGIF